MKRLATYRGGQPLRMKQDFDWLQDGIKEALKAICLGMGNGESVFILWGCQAGLVASGDDWNYSVSEGYMYANGEIFYVPASTVTGSGYSYFYLDLDITYGASGDYRLFKDGNTSHRLHEYRRLKPFWAESIPSTGIVLADVTRFSEATFYYRQQGEWHVADFNDGWFENASYPVKYRKNLDGNTEITGIISHTDQYSNGIAFVLNSFHRPNFAQKIVLHSLSSPRKSVVMTVSTNGNVSMDLTAEDPGTDSFIFNHVIFRG